MYNDEMEQAFKKSDVFNLIKQTVWLFSIRNKAKEIHWIDEEWNPVIGIEVAHKNQALFEDNPLIASALRNYGDRALEEKKYQMAVQLFLAGTFYRLDEEMLGRLSKSLELMNDNNLKFKIDAFYNKSFDKKEKADNINPQLKMLVNIICDKVENHFNLEIFKSEIINLTTYKDDSEWPKWNGLSRPKFEDFDNLYLIIISFEIDKMDDVIMRNGVVSTNNDWDVQNFISTLLGGQEVSAVGAYKVGERRVRTCKFYSGI